MGLNRDSLLVGENAALIDEKYQQWLRDPNAVNSEWAEVFNEWEHNGRETHTGSVPDFPHVSLFAGRAVSARDPLAEQKQSQVAQLMNAYRVWGHKKAHIDPLGQWQQKQHPELTLEFWGLSQADLDIEFPTAPLAGLPDHAPLRAILKHLNWRTAVCWARSL